MWDMRYAERRPTMRRLWSMAEMRFLSGNIYSLPNFGSNPSRIGKANFWPFLPSSCCRSGCGKRAPRNQSPLRLPIGKPEASMSLKEYTRKRDFKKTAEPPAKVGKGSPHSFVIQKHDASRLHYDLRLERMEHSNPGRCPRVCRTLTARSISPFKSRTIR